MTPPLVHQDFRGRVCGVCFLLAGKNARRITNTVLQDLRMYQWEGYSLQNNALPTVVCCSCTNKLARCRGNPDFAPISDFDYKSLVPPPVRTRHSTDRCQCFLCKTGRVTLVIQPKKVEKPVPIKICTDCQGRLAPGMNHICTRTNRNNNILDIVRSLSAKSSGQVLSQSLKDISEQSGSKHLRLATKGPPLPVKLGKENVQKTKFLSKDNLKHLQTQRQFTDNDMNAIEAATRVVFGRKAVESGAREDRVETNHSLDDMFEGRLVKLKLKPKKKKDDDSDSDDSESDSEYDEDGLKDIVRPVALCKDPREFIYRVMMERNLDIENTDIKIGADDGQQIFKINVQLVSKDQPELEADPKTRASYSDGVASKQHKEGSVNKLLILLAVPATQELYHNIKVLLNELNLDTIDFTLTSDLKMVLILLGKDSGACRHACPYCEGSAPWTTPSPANKLSTLQNWHELWLADGSQDSHSKNYQNMRHPPLVSGDPELPILETIVPPELHLMLGVVDKLVTELGKNVFGGKAGKKFMSDFYRKENITVCGKQGGKLEGNSSRKLLKSLDSLELELEKCSPEIYLKSLPFVKALRDFSLVVHLSFGQRLLPRWSQAISSFTLSYTALEKFNGKPVSVTPKAHIVMEHVREFLEMKGSEKGLGYWSEQAFEAVHANFKIIWDKVKVNIEHSDYLAKLTSTVARYNASHI